MCLISFLVSAKIEWYVLYLICSKSGEVVGYSLFLILWILQLPGMDFGVTFFQCVISKLISQNSASGCVGFRYKLFKLIVVNKNRIEHNYYFSQNFLKPS